MAKKLAPISIRTMKMKQKIVGSFLIGTEYCQLVLREGDGGEFYFTPEDGHIARIKIGADVKWDSLVSTFLHEAIELILSRLKTRFERTDVSVNDMGGFLFVMHHTDLADMCGRLADFVVSALPAAEKEWKAWRKNA